MAGANQVPSQNSLTPNFSAQASPPRKAGLFDWLMGGEDDPAKDPAQKASAQAAAQRGQAKLDAENKEAAKKSPSGSPARREFNGSANTGLLFDRVSDKGDYLQTGSQPSDKQLLRMILKGAEKGWDTLYFYKGNEIDGQTAQRAKAMIDQLQNTGAALEGIPMRVSTGKMRGTLEPWRLNPLGLGDSVKSIEDWSDQRQSTAEARKFSRKAEREIS